MLQAQINHKDNVTAIIKNTITGKEKIVKGHNLVTNDGQEHYARMIVGEDSNISDSFVLRLGTDDTDPDKTDNDVNNYIDNSQKEVESNFPKRDFTGDGNDDGGRNVITYKIYYDTGELVADDIIEGALTNDVDNSDDRKALNHYLFDEAFSVTEADSLTIYINHKFTGV